MSDQDEISRLLAEANAQTEADPARNLSPDTPAAVEAPPQPAASVRKHPPRIVGRNSDVLGIALLNGVLHAATFHRQKMTHSWSCPTAVRTVADLEAVLDEALSQLEFDGTETFLVLENEVFAHQADDIPAFSDGVLRTYLKSRIQRHEQEHGPVLWMMQPLIALRQEQSVILHLLPKSFYDELHRVLLKRHLDLTRILPLIAPLQHELNRIPAGKNTPVIVAAEIGANTVVVAGRIGGPLLFSRTILADLHREPGRVGVELNRSLLYTKQHFECAVASVWLMADCSTQATVELQAKCGGKKIVVLPVTPLDWLQTTARLSPQQPINLLSRYLKMKRRNRLVRGMFLAAVWLGLALMISTGLHNADTWRAEKERLADLQGREAALRDERERLVRRNDTTERNQAFIDRVTSDRLPPVPGRLLAFVASVLPENVRLTEFDAKWDAGAAAWSFQITGSIEADDEAARALVAALQTQLTRSPLRARFNDNVRTLFALPVNPASPNEIQRFNLEGTVLEK